MHGRVYIRRGNPGWYYFDLFGWLPFARFNHGGWVVLSFQWWRDHWRRTAR